MAFSWISSEGVLQNIFEDEEALDDSDSEDGKDVYGYLGSLVVPRDQLEEESQHLSTQRRLLDIDGDDEALVSSEDEDELSDDLGGECYEPSLMDCDNDGRS